MDFVIEMGIMADYKNVQPPLSQKDSCHKMHILVKITWCS